MEKLFRSSYSIEHKYRHKNYLKYSNQNIESTQRLTIHSDGINFFKASVIKEIID